MATMRKRHVFRPLWIGWLCVVLCLELLFPLTTARAEETPEPDTDAAASAGSPEALSYFQYYTAYAQAQRPQSAVVLKGTEPTAAAGSGKTDCVSTEADGELYGVLLEESSPWVEWSFDIAETGVYAMYLSYCPAEAHGRDIEVSLLVDEQRPFREAATITLPRLWRDKQQADGETIRRDDFGNDLRPAQEETPRLFTRALADSQGMYAEPYLWYFEAGSHTLRLNLEAEKLLVTSLAMLLHGITRIFRWLFIIGICVGRNKIVNTEVGGGTDPEPFYNGNVYMYAQESFAYYNFAKAIPNKAAFGRSMDNLGIVPVPLGPDNKEGAYPTGWLTCYCSGRGSDPRVAVAWARFSSYYVDPVKPEVSFSDEDTALINSLIKKVSYPNYGFADSSITADTISHNIEGAVMRGEDIAQVLNTWRNPLQNCITATLNEQD